MKTLRDVWKYPARRSSDWKRKTAGSKTNQKILADFHRTVTLTIPCLLTIGMFAQQYGLGFLQQEPCSPIELCTAGLFLESSDVTHPVTFLFLILFARLLGRPTEVPGRFCSFWLCLHGRQLVLFLPFAAHFCSAYMQVSLEGRFVKLKPENVEVAS